MSYPGPEQWMCENDSAGEPDDVLGRLREKAGDGSTDFRVEVWQSELAALISTLDRLADTGDEQ